MRQVHLVLFLVVLLFSVLVLLATWRAINGYVDLRNTTEDYISRQQDASNMKEASDYLTQQGRYFAFTGDRQYLDNYFFEVNTTRRRETALQNMEQSLGSGKASYRALSAAMDRSTALMEQEYYSMRLRVESMGYALLEFPAAIQNVTLSPQDLALTPDEQAAKSLDLLFNEDYRAAKEEIHSNISQCLTNITEEQEALQSSSFQRLLTMMQSQAGFVVLLLAAVLLVTLLTSRLIYRPLQRSVAFVQEQRSIPMEGSAEVRLFASTYNIMFEENRKNKEQLSYDATHDILTGLYNRKAYENIFRSVEEPTIALLLIDVDYFKSINDTYGHETGDKVLTNVALTLMSNFRADDFVCRIGGDEFAVIMTNMTSELQDLVAAKVQKANDQLQHPKADLPPISLSVGVAFGDRKNSTGNIFKDVDAALYEVKRNGRNGCAFYNGQPPSEKHEGTR